MMHRSPALLVVAALLFAPRASAGTDPAAAEQLFAEGRALMAEKKYDLACAKLEASERLDPGAGTLLNLAGCYELAGRTASAWATYRDAESAASQSNRGDWAKTAHDRAEAIRPKLSYLAVRVPHLVDGLVVERDGKTVDPAVYGVAVPADPGSHTISARAPGYEGWTQKLDVSGRVDIDIPLLARPKALVQESPPPTHSWWSPQRTIAVATGGAGVVSLVVGSVLALHARSTYDDALASECHDDAKRCTQSGVDGVDSAHRQATSATVFMIAGGVLASTGLVLFFTSPSTQVAVSPGGVRGTF